MKKEAKNILNIVCRYLILILIAIPNLYLFYLILTPITVFLVYSIIRLTYSAILIKPNLILIGNEIPIELIPACIAGSAYYLLSILNLSTPKINLKKRIIILALSFLSLLILNVLRIYLLTIFLVNSGENSFFFDFLHKFFWYFMSIFFVVGIWFANVKIFKIKEKPFYSDMKYLFKHSNLYKK